MECLAAGARRGRSFGQLAGSGHRRRRVRGRLSRNGEVPVLPKPPVRPGRNQPERASASASGTAADGISARHRSARRMRVVHGAAFHGGRRVCVHSGEVGPVRRLAGLVAERGRPTPVRLARSETRHLRGRCRVDRVQFRSAKDRHDNGAHLRQDSGHGSKRARTSGRTYGVRSSTGQNRSSASSSSWRGRSCASSG